MAWLTEIRHTISQRNFKELWLCVNKRSPFEQSHQITKNTRTIKILFAKELKDYRNGKQDSFVGISSQAGNEGAFLVKRKTSSEAASGNGVIISLLPSLDPMVEMKRTPR